MNKLEQLLKDKVGTKPLFMCHLIAGYPTQKESIAISKALLNAGADILEIQIPFSDPMADGSSISVASREALERGASVKNSLSVVKSVSKGAASIVIMSYLNPVYRYGIAKFARDATKAGATALIIPDAPFDTEEGKELVAEAKKNGLCMIPVISPGVPHERLRELAQDARGFVYCTSRQGITGANGKFVADLKSYMQEVREVFSIPLGLGFGIQTPADAKKASKLADIVIAGSVFVNAIRQSKKGKTASAVKICAIRLFAR